jgi:amidohydrolase
MTSLFPLVKEQKNYMTELRRHFHKYPESGYAEFKTAERIEEELLAMGIPHRRVGETGVLATIKGGAATGTGRIIVLRADIDALRIQEENDVPYRSQNDGVMHACGHDGHTAALLGTAKVLSKKRDGFSGEARLCFQQAEETSGGAKFFIADGVLEGAGRVFSIHMKPDIDAGQIGVIPGPMNAAVDGFRLTVKGKSAHVAHPQRGADALFAACQIVNAFQSLVTRRISPVDTVIIGVGTLHAGTASNIIAEEAVMQGTLRTYSAELRDKLVKLINETSAHVAAISGAEREIEWFDPYPVLINDAEACKEAAEIAALIAGKEAVISDLPRSLGGDDFAEFLLAVPGVYVNIGCGFPGKPRIALHNCRFDMDEEALVFAAGMYADYAAWYLGIAQ